VMADGYDDRPQGFLGKPFGIDDLRDVIRHALATPKT